MMNQNFDLIVESVQANNTLLELVLSKKLGREVKVVKQRTYLGEGKGWLPGGSAFCRKTRANLVNFGIELAVC